MNAMSIGQRMPVVRRAVLLSAAAAAAVCSLSVQAAIVDSGPVSINIPQNIDGVYLNVVTGVSSGSAAAVPGWDLDPFAQAAGLSFFWPSAPANSQGGVSSGGTYTNLAVGATVDGAATYLLSAQSAASGAFRVGGTAILGFRFQNEATNAVNYGYAIINTTAGTGFPATIVRYVYENTGLPITVVGPSTAPTFAYTPPTASTVGFTGSTTVGGTANGSITVALGTPAGSGTGASATTTLTCTAPTAPFAGFGQTITAVGNGAISGTSLSGTCTVGASAVTQALTCNENRGGSNNARTWTLSCPAAVVPVTSVPASGSTVSLSQTVGAGPATANIVFTNPGATASAMTCTITGPGAAAFSTTNPNPNVPPNGGTATVPVSYTSATAGSFSATLTCTGAQTFTFPLNGTTGAPAPTQIPVFHGKGLWVMLMLVFGFGLATLVVRRS